MGSGRGGTSLLAGMIARVGYYAGDQLHPPRDANPKGFFEDVEINSINEELLREVTPGLTDGQRWLAALPTDRRIPEPDEQVKRRIAAQVSHSPFCLKDPRFCYTLDAWRPYVGDAVFLCVFRSPLATARSIIAEVGREDYLAPLRAEMTEMRAVSIWSAMFRYLLERQADSGEWLFIHYEQLIDGSGISKLETALGTRVDGHLADRSLNRTSPKGRLRGEARGIYRELCERAGYPWHNRQMRRRLPGLRRRLSLRTEPL